MAYSSGHLPPLDCLVAVLEASRAGSFSATAEALGVTHAAISRRVHVVEHWLGTALFERHGRGVRPTPAGQRFVAEVEAALAGIRESAERWKPRAELPTVRISVLPSFARLWLLPRLAVLQGTPARVRIELVLEHRLADLGEGGVDLAIRYGRGRSTPGGDSRLLLRETLFPVAAPRLAAQLGTHPGPARIAALPLLHDSDASQWRSWLADGGHRLRPKSSDRRFEDYDLVLVAACAGLGVALLRSPLADAWLGDGRLTRIYGGALPNPMAHHLVSARGGASAARDFVVEGLLAAARESG